MTETLPQLKTTPALAPSPITTIYNQQKLQQHCNFAEIVSLRVTDIHPYTVQVHSMRANWCEAFPSSSTKNIWTFLDIDNRGSMGPS